MGGKPVHGIGEQSLHVGTAEPGFGCIQLFPVSFAAVWNCPKYVCLYAELGPARAYGEYIRFQNIGPVYRQCSYLA